MSNRKVIELLLQLKNAKDHGENYIKVKQQLIRYLMRNRLLVKATMAWCDLSPRFFCMDATLLCEIESDIKI